MSLHVGNIIYGQLLIYLTYVDLLIGAAILEAVERGDGGGGY